MPRKSAKDRRPEAEEGGDHGDEFDVAEAEAFAVAEGLVGEADEEQDAGGEGDGEEAAEDEVLGAGEDYVAVVDGAADAGEGVVAVEQEVVLVGREVGGADADEQEAEERAGEGEGVGEGVGLPVHDEEADEEEAEDGEGDGVDEVVAKALVEMPGVRRGKAVRAAKVSQRAKASSTSGIAPGDALLAVAATGTEKKPAEEGDVVVPGDGVETVGAVRARLAEAAVVGQTRDADVEKAAEEKAEEKGWQLEDEWSGEHESSV